MVTIQFSDTNYITVQNKQAQNYISGHFVFILDLFN